MTRCVELDSVERVREVVGPSDAYLRRLGTEFGVRAVARGKEVIFDGEGDSVEAAVGALKVMIDHLEGGRLLSPESLSEIISSAVPIGGELPDGIGQAGFEVTGDRFVRPRTDGQWDYARAMATDDVVFAIGPAGTGKTYLAVAAALQALQQGKVNRLVLVRPAVEAGEKLGFLPGDLLEKVNPYLRPLYDALQDMLSFDRVERYISQGIIEVVPLAFMRGRTMNRAAVILDEAQNTTSLQMKMFLTRLGLGSRATITGDITQIAIVGSRGSGLVEAEGILAGIEGLTFCKLTEIDIVRHPLVRRIVNAYDERVVRDGLRGNGGGTEEGTVQR